MKAVIIASGRKMLIPLFDARELESEQAQPLEEAEVTSDMVQQVIQESACTALNQVKY